MGNMIFPFLTHCYCRFGQLQSEPAASCSVLKELADGAASLYIHHILSLRCWCCQNSLLMQVL